MTAAQTPSQPSPEASAKDYIDLLKQIVTPVGLPLASIAGFSHENLETLYGVAYQTYQRGKIQEAHEIFRFLTLNDPTEAKHWIGLGITRQQLKMYKEAGEAYALATLLDHENPEPVVSAAECVLHQGDLPGAIEVLKEAIRRAGKQDNYRQLKERAQLLQKTIEDQLEKTKKKED